MATHSLHSLHHSLLKRHHSDLCPTTTFSSTLFLKPAASSGGATISLSSTAASFSLSAATSSTPYTSSATSFDQLHQHLSTKNFREADEETRRLLIVLAGEAAQKRGYVYFSEVQFISADDLKTIDELWKKHSDGKFGYSVQKKIYEKVNRDFTKLFMKLGWMKKLDTEIEQFNYRSFPTEFIWELNEETPEGHLPLTNALRGTQLFTKILNHPAFEEIEDEEKEEEEEEGKSNVEEIRGNENGGIKRIFKTDYSF